MSKMDIVELRLRRTVALIIDWYITNMLASIPITFFLRRDSQFKPEMFELTVYGFNTALIVCLIAITIGILYYVFIPLYIWKGQTPGKKICKIKVIDYDYKDVTMKNMMLRELLGATLLEGGITIIPSYLRKIASLLQFTSIVNPLTYAAYALTLVSIGYAYFQKDTRCFHDLVSHTEVIKL